MKRLKLFIIFVLSVVFLSIISPVNTGVYTTKTIYKTSNIKDQLTSKTSDFDILEMITKINESILRSHVQKLQDFGPHPTGSKTLEQVADYIYSELSNNNYSVIFQNWQYDGKQEKNIEATLKGLGSTDSIVILCAHYDSVSYSPGADDDGSGVASILTIAEILKDHAFNSTIKFVLFSGEEQGHLGSDFYVQEAYGRGDKITAVINLDGVGYASDSLNGSMVRNLIEDESKWIADIGKQVSNEFSSVINLTIVDYINDIHADHQPFIDHGYDAIMVLEKELNPFYHTTEDTIDHMNISYLTKICRLALGTLVKIAELESMLNEEDLIIRIKGMLLSYPAQLCVSIQNACYPKDTANLTVTVSFINIFTGKLVQGMYNSTTCWVINTEIKEYWEFKLGNRRYKREPFICKIELVGYNDDIFIHKEVRTFGIVFSAYLFIIPYLK
jgi:hypothetical protein